MWQINCNYKRDNTDTKFPFCKKAEDTTEHVLECEKLSKENSKGEWEQKTEIYRKNKTKRELTVIKVQDLNKIIKQSRKKNKIRKTKEKKKCRKINRKGKQKIYRKKVEKKRTEG